MARIARVPLALVRKDMAVPVLRGGLRGKRWIVGSAIHRCWLGFYENEKQQLISREVRADSVFWDVGANVGFYSLLASGLVGSGKVFAFEPVPRNLSFLTKHLALNRITNVEVLAIAVCDRDGDSPFEVEQTGFMGLLSNKGSITVPTATLDSLVEGGKVLPPDYVKMDIEGGELLALRGANNIFRRYHPLLFLATHGAKVHKECCRLLESWGYTCKLLRASSLQDRAEVVARYG